jgi:hypothetical protein
MRAHPVYTAFQKRWQIHTYFQLRWKEIVVKLEEALASTKLDILKGKLPRVNRRPRVLTYLENAPFSTNQAVAVWDAISTCWSNEVYMPVLSHRFWKLMLQVRRETLWILADLTL